MSFTVWKYSLERRGRQVIPMPAGAVVLTVQEQFDEIAVWVAVDPSHPKQERVFRVTWTGEQLRREPNRYMGTVQLNDGGLVCHVFEETPGGSA